ncbi:hypothetical protein SA22_0432 [Salmonella enterica subsp. enterica serovar Agona str. 22.H.04]|uniref:Uncharacterized protein n=2 Tax=Salmonella enterica I TaxID=59201 RepID=B5F7U5_SALA4|nr:hypothetical protein SeAg_B0125 [Salmonella enterica subsp. enterica serovar Agona str. SL483]EDX46782.1 hypothetical protein SeKA_A4390 [Salmonella enterica subsp. enterica serovar Kentucky str. CVM29188]EDZ21952.1 hypothetical protein SeKB_A0166 [Salmonella enterica subsp. enterica serovar Kentucky str. CDC 191]EDZ29158.1 hypothetical protein SeW_A0167 [Salmonella enterica subsp. enterica serovar Weltevreden str. HI_N05-537]EDZ35594.1 hypothetical protein SeH_A0332 [Salmonella enterica sub
MPEYPRHERLMSNPALDGATLIRPTGYSGNLVILHNL